jgi:hypothetical protein
MSIEEDVRGYLALRVAERFDNRDVIVEGACDLFSDEVPREELARIVDQVYDEVVTADAEAQHGWPSTTDCDRLDAAFVALDARGIMARHKWWCCQTCGHGAMPEEYQRVTMARQLPRVRGYAFYHDQDVEAAADGGGLYVAYGAVEDGEAAATKIAAEIVAVLREHGLSPSWDGSVRTRIELPMKWQRRGLPPEPIP